MSVPVPSPSQSTPLRAAWALSRSVEASRGRVQLKELLHRLTWQVPGDAPGMHSVGYFGRRRRAQLHGYLIVDQEHKRFAEQSMPVRVHPLPDDVRATLRAAHEEICALNMACLRPVVERFPQWAQVLDPYGLLEPLRPIESVPGDSLILTAEAISTMATAFLSHFSFSILADVDPVPEENYVLDGVEQLESELESWGAMNSPPFIEAFKKRLAPGVPARHAFRVVEAIVCLRASLRVLDQIIFQKLKAEKLPHLSDQEIFAVPLISMHDTGRGMSIVFQPSATEHHFEGGELIFVKEIELHTFPDQSLYQVAKASHLAPLSAFSEDGETANCELRPIDENLCPFKEMWKGMYDRVTPGSLMGVEEEVSDSASP